MKKQMMMVAVGMLGIVGCMTSGEKSNEACGATLPPNIDKVSVVVSQGRTLKDAVVYAATHRRWVPEEVDAATIRCTLVQRAHKVVIDVRLLDERHYSIGMIESNIPARKVASWVNNLQREIAKYAVGR